MALSIHRALAAVVMIGSIAGLSGLGHAAAPSGPGLNAGRIGAGAPESFADAIEWGPGSAPSRCAGGACVSRAPDAASFSVAGHALDLGDRHSTSRFLDGRGHHDAIRPSPTSVPSVPEPETYALLLAGLVAVIFVARRRR